MSYEEKIFPSDTTDTEETDSGKTAEWFFHENVRLEQQRNELERERVKLERQKRDFQFEKERVAEVNRLEKSRMDQEKKLFEMKWKVLEDELRKLAEDKRQIEQERQEYQALRQQTSNSNVHYEIFFIGVNSKQALKKRYKDLIKIFHPDNLSGDKSTLQEINREYDTLKQIFI